MNELQQWQRDTFPNDLGDGVHRWSWLMCVGDDERQQKNILWLHLCGGRWSTSWIDITSGTRHRLITEDPLHIEASVLCPTGCGDHGFIRDGKWESA